MKGKSGAPAPHSKAQATIGRRNCGHVLECGGVPALFMRRQITL